MTNRLWAVVEREPEKGKYVAYAYSFLRNHNLVGIVENYSTFMICESKKKAVELADYWNDCYKANGTYALDKEDRPTEKSEYISKYEDDIRSAIYDFLVETFGEIRYREDLYMYIRDGKPEFITFLNADGRWSINDDHITICIHEPDTNGDEAEMLALDDDKDGWIDETQLDYWMEELKKAMGEKGKK